MILVLVIGGRARDYIIPKRRQGLYLVVLSGIFPANWVIICYRSHHLQEPENSIESLAVCLLEPSQGTNLGAPSLHNRPDVKTPQGLCGSNDHGGCV